MRLFDVYISYITERHLITQRNLIISGDLKEFDNWGRFLYLFDMQRLK